MRVALHDAPGVLGHGSFPFLTATAGGVALAIHLMDDHGSSKKENIAE